LEEVDHVAARIVKLEKAIDEEVQKAPPEIRAVVEALQALRGWHKPRRPRLFLRLVRSRVLRARES